MSNLKQRNFAVLLALVGFMALIFTITIVRIQQGTAVHMAQKAAAEAATPSVAAPTGQETNGQKPRTP